MGDKVVNNKPTMTDQAKSQIDKNNSKAKVEGNGLKQAVVNACKTIDNGPRVLKLYMEMCAKCGTCADQCPVYQGEPTDLRNPVIRSNLIRSVFKKYSTPSGKLFGPLAGAEDFDGDMKKFVDAFYECTGCRRCATFCPMSIDNSVITRKGRTIADNLGYTPDRLMKVINISLETGNTDGANIVAFQQSVEFLEEEIKDSCGLDVKIPYDVVGADVFFVPPSGDLLVNPEAVMGIAKIFHKLGVSWTLSSKAFDGANYGLFTGDDASMKADNKLYVDEAHRFGSKMLMMGECGHAHRIMKFIMEKAGWWGELPFEITNVLQYTAEMVTDGAITFDKSKNPDPVTYHDPCNFGRSCGIVEEPRIIMKAACADFREMTPNREQNWCCGGGGGLSAMDDIYEFRMNVSGKMKLQQIDATGAKFCAAPCSNCKRQLMQLMEYHKRDVVIGGVHDMVFNAIKM
ncbi:MAG: (Fe-S)-binding protein [candidate division Zixibacteria bacterium]|nr:(Fe-S)-binding protein [candidate division Zixibacteria bacterium]